MADSAPETAYPKKAAYPEIPKPNTRRARPAVQPAAMIGVKGAKAPKMPEPAQIAQMLRTMAAARSGR